MLDEANVTRVVHDVLTDVAARRSLELNGIRSDMRLVDEIGFASLDLARIIAVLEMRLGVDPFARLIPVTSIRTVGDLCRAYCVGLQERERSQADNRENHNG